MKIEANTFYKTRGGRTAYVGYSYLAHDQVRWVGHIEQGEPVYWNDEGELNGKPRHMWLIMACQEIEINDENSDKKLCRCTEGIQKILSA